MGKIIKRFSLILMALCVVNGVLFAADSSVSGDSLYAEDKLRKTPHYATSLDLNVKCRRLKDEKLKTQIVDFDIEKGITYCQTYKKDNPDFILTVDSDAFWIVKNSGSTEEIKNPTSVAAKTSSIGKNTGNSSDGDTLSTFLVKTVLLMDNSSGSKGTVVTEYDASDLTQTWNNSSGFKETATNMLSSLWENIKKPLKYIGSKVGIDTEIATKELKVPYVATASDGFDAYNIAYYRVLFAVGF